MNNTDGALNFDASIDFSLIQKAIQQSESLIKNYANTSIAEFAKIDEAVNKVSQHMELLLSKNVSRLGLDLNTTNIPTPKLNNAEEIVKQKVIISEYKGYIKETTEEIKKLQEKQKNLPENGKAWDELNRRVLDSKAGISTFIKEIETAKNKIKELSEGNQIKFGNIDKAKKGVEDLSRTTENETSKMEGYFNKISTGLGVYFSITTLKNFANELIKVRGEFQQNQIAFEVMLKSKAKSDKLMSEIVNFAADSPFGLQSSANAAKQLLAYGSAAEEVKNELKTLGDIAAGVSQPIGDLVYLYGTLRTQGRAYSVDIRQFAGRGIPIYEELAKVMKVNKEEINGLVEAGKIGFPEVQKALQNMAGEGGKFYNLMEKQTESLTGQQEKLKDAIEVMLNDLGTKTQDILGGGISAAAFLVENYEAVIKILGVLVSTYGAYKTALILVNTYEKANASINTITTIINLTRATQGLTTVSRARALALAAEAVAQKALNAVMSANPYVLAATLIVGLTASIWALHDGTTAQERAQSLLNATLENGKKKIDELEGNTNKLVGIINSETKTILDQMTAFNELQKLYPSFLKNLDFHSFKAMSTSDQQKLLNEAINDFDTKKFTSELQEAISMKEKFWSGEIDSSDLDKYLRSKDSNYKYNGLWEQIQTINEYIDKLKEEEEEREKLRKEAEFQNLPEKDKIKFLNDQLDKLKQQKLALEDNIKNANILGDRFSLLPGYLNNTNTALGNVLFKISETTNKVKSLSNDPDKKNRGYWDDVLKNSQEAIDKMETSEKGSKEWNEHVNNIKLARSNLEKYNITFQSTTKGIKSIKTKKEFYPLGSLKYWEEISKKAEDILSKTPINNISLIKKEKQIKLNADREIEKIKKQLAVKNFNEEIEYKQQKYSQYYKWIEILGKDSADKQFEDLIKSGESFSVYLENVKNELLKKQSTNNFSLEDGLNLSIVTDQLNNINGVKSAIDNFKDSISNAKDESRSLFEYLEKILNERNKLDSGETNLIGEQKIEGRIFLNEEEKQAKKEVLNSILNTYRSFEQQRLEIYKLSEEKIKFARENGLEDRISLIKKEQEQLLSELTATEIEGNRLWKSLFSTMEGISLKTFKDISEELQKLINQIKDPEIRGQYQKQLDQYKYSISNPLQRVQDSIKKYNEARKKLNEALKTGDKLQITIATGQAETALKDLSKRFIDLGDQAIGVLNSINKGLNDLGFNTQVTDQLTSSLENVLNIFKGFKGEEINFTQITSGAVGIVTTAFELFDKRSRKLQKRTNKLKSELAEIQRAFSNLEYAASNAIGENYYSAQTDKIKNLQEQQKKLYELIANEQKKSSKKKNKGSIEDWKNQINDINNQIKDIEKQIIESFAQTNFKNLSSQLADVFVNAFSEGKDAAKDFETVFNNVISNAIKNALQMKILEPVVSNFIDSIADYMSGNNNSLSGFNFDHWKTLLSSAGNQFTEALEGFEKFFNVLDPTKMDPLSGAIKGVSEETASLIAGQMNAIRINQVVTTERIVEMLTVLSKIETNTYNLFSIEKIMKGLESYIKSKSGLNDAKAKGILF